MKLCKPIYTYIKKTLIFPRRSIGRKISVMILYDYLFYCSYKMGMHSNNFVGLPVLAGMTMIVPNVAIHIAISVTLLKHVGFIWPSKLLDEGVWGRVLYVSVFVCIYWYYAYKGRYKRLVEKYNLGKDTYWKRHPFITIVVYFIISLITMAFVGVFVKMTSLF